MTDLETPNREQAKAWNEQSGPTWVELQALLDRMLEPFERRLADEGFPGVGKRVLDIGCGSGATTLAMARRVGPQGFCLGADISAPLVAAAKARAKTEGLSQADFIVADAQVHPFEAGSFDAVISRFGVMFFEDPAAAFANIRRAVAPGGRLSFAAWRSSAENAFFIAGAKAVAPFFPPQAPPEPNAPGQFAFADERRVRAILEGAGWREVDIRPTDDALVMGREELMLYVTRMGPAAAALREANEATRAAAVRALEAAFQPYVDGEIVRLTAACWQVTARA